MVKKAGNTAYEHYLATGDIFGMYEGAVIRGNGTPPDNPMGFDLFLEKSRQIPPPSNPQNRDPWSDELVKKTMWSNPKITNLARDQGWILGLHDFIRDRHRLPKNHEFDKLRRNAAFVRECAAGREGVSASHRALAQSLMDKRERLTEEFAR